LDETIMPQATLKEPSQEKTSRMDELPSPDDQSSEKETDSFKTLLRDFALGRSQNPDSAPGLQFYVVFGVMIGLALGLVALIAIVLSVVNLFRG
jgi:tetrahydromethanopterin S-methyltransferase subunit B